MDNQNGGTPNPNYPDQPTAPAPEYPPQPAQTPEYPAQPAQAPEYPTQAPEYPTAPEQPPVYPTQPVQAQGYPTPPAQTPVYPAQPMQAPGYPTQTPGYPGYPVTPPVETIPAPAKKSKKKLFIIVGSIAAIVIGIAVWLTSCFLNNGNNPTEVTKKYIKSYVDTDRQTYESCLLRGGEDYHKHRAEKKDMDLDEYFERMTDGEENSYSGYCEFYNETAKKQLKKQFGDNISIDFKKITEEYSDKEELKKVKNAYKNYDYINADKISEACKVKVTFEIKGSDKTDEETINVTLVKYDGKWKIQN